MYSQILVPTLPPECTLSHRSTCRQENESVDRGRRENERMQLCVPIGVAQWHRRLQQRACPCADTVNMHTPIITTIITTMTAIDTDIIRVVIITIIASTIRPRHTFTLIITLITSNTITITTTSIIIAITVLTRRLITETGEIARVVHTTTLKRELLLFHCYFCFCFCFDYCCCYYCCCWS